MHRGAVRNGLEQLRRPAVVCRIFLATLHCKPDERRHFAGRSRDNFGRETGLGMAEELRTLERPERFELPTYGSGGLAARETKSLARLVWSEIRQYLWGFLTPCPHCKPTANKQPVGTMIDRETRTQKAFARFHHVPPCCAETTDLCCVSRAYVVRGRTWSKTRLFGFVASRIWRSVAKSRRHLGPTVVAAKGSRPTMERTLSRMRVGWVRTRVTTNAIR